MVAISFRQRLVFGEQGILRIPTPLPVRGHGAFSISRLKSRRKALVRSILRIQIGHQVGNVAERRQFRHGALRASRQRLRRWEFLLRRAAIFQPPRVSAVREPHPTRKDPWLPMPWRPLLWSACQCEREPSLLWPFSSLRYIVTHAGVISQRYPGPWSLL